MVKELSVPHPNHPNSSCVVVNRCVQRLWKEEKDLIITYDAPSRYRCHMKAYDCLEGSRRNKHMYRESRDHWQPCPSKRQLLKHFQWIHDFGGDWSGTKGVFWEASGSLSQTFGERRDNLHLIRNAGVRTNDKQVQDLVATSLCTTRFQDTCVTF